MVRHMDLRRRPTPEYLARCDMRFSIVWDPWGEVLYGTVLSMGHSGMLWGRTSHMCGWLPATVCVVWSMMHGDSG